MCLASDTANVLQLVMTDRLREPVNNSFTITKHDQHKNKITSTKFWNHRPLKKNDDELKKKTPFNEKKAPSTKLPKNVIHLKTSPRLYSNPQKEREKKTNGK